MLIAVTLSPSYCLEVARANEADGLPNCLILIVYEPSHSWLQSFSGLELQCSPAFSTPATGKKDPGFNHNRAGMSP